MELPVINEFDGDVSHGIDNDNDQEVNSPGLPLSIVEIRAQASHSMMKWRPDDVAKKATTGMTRPDGPDSLSATQRLRRPTKFPRPLGSPGSAKRKLPVQISPGSSSRDLSREGSSSRVLSPKSSSPLSRKSSSRTFITDQP